MLVSEFMTKEVRTVDSGASLIDAFGIMYEGGNSQLPVLHNGKFAGLITEKLLSEYSPSKATRLNLYETHWLLREMKVETMMIKHPITIRPEAILEDAALVMRDHNIGSLPVVDATDTLVGIITRYDIFNSYIESMGVNEKGTRIAIRPLEHLGVFVEIAQIINDFGITIYNISNCRLETGLEIIVKIAATNVSGLIEKLEEKGHTIKSVRVNN